MLSDDIKAQIQAIENNLNPSHYSASSEAKQGGNLGSQWANAQNQTCFNSQMCAAKAAEFQSLAKRINEERAKIESLKIQLNEQLQKETEEEKIKTQLDISPSNLTPFGESIETIIQKPENKALILIAGLIAAAIILKT